MEPGKHESDKHGEKNIAFPVYYGDQGVATVTDEIGVRHSGCPCGLVVEPVRVWTGNTVYRNPIRTPVIADVAGCVETIDASTAREFTLLQR